MFSSGYLKNLIKMHADILDVLKKPVKLHEVILVILKKIGSGNAAYVTQIYEKICENHDDFRIFEIFEV